MKPCQRQLWQFNSNLPPRNFRQDFSLKQNSQAKKPWIKQNIINKILKCLQAEEEYTSNEWIQHLQTINMNIIHYCQLQCNKFVNNNVKVIVLLFRTNSYVAVVQSKTTRGWLACYRHKLTFRQNIQPIKFVYFKVNI